MIQFDEEKSIEKFKAFRKGEEERLAEILSEKYGVGYVDLSQVSIDPDALKIIPETDARNLGIAAFARVNKKIRVGILSPKKTGVAEKIKELEEKGYSVEKYMVSSRSLERAWERYKDLSFATETKSGILEISNEDIEASIKEISNVADAKEVINSTLSLKKGFKISRIVETFLASAMAVNASDVHIEPEESHVRLRFRLNGILTDIINFDRETYELLLSRIKLLSGLKLNIKKESQDGRFSITVSQAEIEIRTSVLPGSYGEAVVMRILNPETIKLSMEKLGMDDDILKSILKEIGRPNGMILNTGPTGSGKTTTLYAFLNKVHEPDIKIITIEDPIEYHLPGVVQTQVDRKKQYNFSTGLRSALRQDPDIIMVGEIRDKETAKIAINSSLTGHLVFSTLHTNSAAGTFARLIDLGVDPKSIGPALNIAMAQRLVRTLDENKKKIPLEGEDRVLVEKILADVPNKKKIPQMDYVWVPNTTEGGESTGYKGRIGIFEVILVNDEMEELVSGSPREVEVENLAKKQGFITIAQDGIIKVLKGMTSLDEVKRVVDLENL